MKNWKPALKGFAGAASTFVGGVIVILGVIPGMVLILGLGLIAFGLWLVEETP